ncbi:hypothetical protein BT63DRAFT_451015 [Microthyrium microscopicum]|uniref:DUF427 domain-containing protein n=1 Tax=Microthyrium microscopicum TaxID=703497 RepID=A0A6A6UPH0_9PEZI|nr:hypothetical protein BT63DRAFT_451015 [Microthyrium microscopicum]
MSIIAISRGGVKLTTGFPTDNKRLDGLLFIPTDDVDPKYLEESDKVADHERYGTMRYYNLVFGKKKGLENGAVYFDDEKKAKDMKGWIGFKITRSGDPGNPHYHLFDEPEGDGVTEEQCWFG